MRKLLRDLHPVFWVFLAFVVIVVVAEIFVITHFVVKFW